MVPIIWARALHQVIEALKSSKVPRSWSPTAASLQAWRRVNEPNSETSYASQWDVLIENRLDILRWPPVLRRFVGVTTPYIFLDGNDTVAISPAQGRGASFTFATPHELNDALSSANLCSPTEEVSTVDVLNSRAVSILGTDRATVLRALSSLVRQSWEKKCRERGLIEFVISGARRCWYLEAGTLPKNEVKYIDMGGKVRRRSLVGRSKKRKVYWHFAIEASLSIDECSIRVRPHVVFSEDGKTPIKSVNRQHSLRRSFCRNWWNDRWRDLLAAMLKYVSSGEEYFKMPVSSSEAFAVSSRLVSYEGVGNTGSRLRFLPEPPIEVGFSQKVDDPREGLMLFGPVSFERNPTEVRVGVIGTSAGVELFGKWCVSFNRPVLQSDKKKSEREVPFPGFEAVFNARWPRQPSTARIVSRTDLLNAIRMRDRHQAVYTAVDLFVEEVQKSTIDDDVQVDIWFIVIPDEIYLYGRPDSRVPKAISLAPVTKVNKRIAKRFSKEAPSIFPEDNAAARIYDHHADFHHQLKARLLAVRAITQVLRESSISHSLNAEEEKVVEEGDVPATSDSVEDGTERHMQDALDVYWNLSVACYFKAGGRPWKVTTARPGVCYVGLIFKRDELKSGGHACCGAQMFMDTGEGLVFKGAMGPWYSARTGQFHLSMSESKRLMGRVLEAYREAHGEYPEELFVHGRTRFSSSELDGFFAAASGRTVVTGVRITRTNEYKLFSSGEQAVKRGTVLLLNERTGLIWTSGFIERLKTYQGRETPNPLRVEVCGKSDANIDTILRDILALTKMNFNSSIYADGYPVTMRFADSIGDVLMATQETDTPPLPFRHYI